MASLQEVREAGGSQILTISESQKRTYHEISKKLFLLISLRRNPEAVQKICLHDILTSPPGGGYHSHLQNII